MLDCFASVEQQGDPRSIRDLVLPQLRLLVLAPHPDDFDSIGVTLRFLWKIGCSLDAVVVRTGGGVEDAYCPNLTLKQRADLREEEQRRSIRFFGLPEECLLFPALINDAADEIADLSENRDRLAAILEAKRPDIVFLPHGNDTNIGHITMYLLFKQVLATLSHPPAALLFRDPKTVGMRPDLYMPFAHSEGEWKAELLRFHDSQHQRNLRTRGHGFDVRILESNRQIARDLGLDDKYAEAFEVELQ